MSRPIISSCRHGNIAVVLVVLWLMSSLPSVQAASSFNSTCPLPSDKDNEYHFSVSEWVTRGGCIREKHQQNCTAILEHILENLTQLRAAEYASAASVLSLLPTIGALFGPPTSEIWRLKSIVPFGGWMAMTLSFGGALMPVRVEDYEEVVAKDNTAIGSIITLRQNFRRIQKDAPNIDDRILELKQTIRQRLERPESIRLPKNTLYFGLFIMFILFAMAQAAMGVVEQGGVINFYCEGRWWMHMWYFLVTATAFAEDRAHRPFKKTYRLYVSCLPYQVDIQGGQKISADTVSENALARLKTLQAASINFIGSDLKTSPRNCVMIMVSIVGRQKWEPFWQRASRVFSVVVFVTGTAFFAAVVLLSLIMSVAVLTLTLAAGILGRAIATWVVSHVAGAGPVIHIISSTQEEAYKAISEIVGLETQEGSPFQVEIDGHIFISKRRVATRSWLKVAMFGVLAEPYDIAESYRKRKASLGAGMSLNPLSPESITASKGGDSSPFLSGITGPTLPFHRTDNDQTKSNSQQSVQSFPYNNTADDGSHPITRQPVPNSA